MLQRRVAFASFCAVLGALPIAAQADTSKDRDLLCSAYYEVLSVAGDQPDISRKQSSQASYALLNHAGFSPENQEAVAVNMTQLSKETPGPMTAASTAKLRAKYDTACRTLLKPAWCHTYKDPSACQE